MPAPDRLKAEVVAWRRRVGLPWEKAVDGQYADVPTARRAVRRALAAETEATRRRLAELDDLTATVFGGGRDDVA